MVRWGMAPLPDDLTTTLTRVARAQRSLSAESLAPLGLHPGQDELLRLLWRQDGLVQSRIVDALGVEAPTVTKMVHRLELAGFVQRRAAPADRRATQVWLTPAGRQLPPAVQRLRKRIDRRMTDGFTDRQAATLQALLERILTNLDDQ